MTVEPVIQESAVVGCYYELAVLVKRHGNV